ncbi:hypothetical protein D3C71_998750 [compost metagenome]
MPPFVRLQWVSDEIRDKYEPLLNKAKQVFPVLEKESVYHGLRKATTDSVLPEQLDEKTWHYLQKGCYVMPLKMVGTYNGMSNYHPQVIPGQRWHYYTCVADSLETAREFEEADRTGDNIVLGSLLGYPKCCTEAYMKNSRLKYHDSVWQQALLCDEEHIKKKEDNMISLKDIPWYNNALLRNLGLSLIFHSKDRIDCPHTEEVVLNWLKLARELKVSGLRELEMFLRMPMEWDCNKGIAYVRTPLFKVSYNSNMTIEKYVVRVDGTYFPEDAPKGNEYPWSEFWTTAARNGNRLEEDESE